MGYIQGKLVDIFETHCNLSCEEFIEIKERLIDLVGMVDEEEPWSLIEVEVDELNVIFEFLFNVKQLTLKEYNDLCNMVSTISKPAQIAEEEET